jgi:thiol-disulfide isomerase/thioredoxin
MYWVDWCKFCKKAKPEWNQLKDEYNGKVINGKKILIVDIDCTKNEEIAEEEDIKGYPTFKFNLDGKYYDYPDQPVYDKFKTFIEYLVGAQD